MRLLGGSLTASHMYPGRVQAFFGDKHQLPGIDNLRPGGNLTKELIYENNSSAQKFHVAVWEKAVADVASGRAIVFPKEQAGQVEGLRVSPVGEWKSGKR